MTGAGTAACQFVQIGEIRVKRFTRIARIGTSFKEPGASVSLSALRSFSELVAEFHSPSPPSGSHCFTVRANW
jgi:hypothetical protein